MFSRRYHLCALLFMAALHHPPGGGLYGGAGTHAAQAVCAITPASLPDGVRDVDYEQIITAAGGTAPYRFAVTAGALPGGLALSTGGALAGSPTVVGTFNFVVTATAPNGCTGTRSYTVTVSTGFLYVLNDSGGGNRIYGYAVSEATGTLTPLTGFPIAAGNGNDLFAGERLAINRATQRLYVINAGANTVTAYTINVTGATGATVGALTALPFSPINLGTGDWFTLAVHPSGSPLLVGNNSNPGRMASFRLTNTMATAAAGSPYATGNATPFSTAFSQSGEYVYTGGGGEVTTTLAGFGVNAATGVLTALAGSPFAAGTSNPRAFASDAAGRLFLANQTAGDVRVFTTTNGIPRAVTGNPFASGLANAAFGLLHPNGFYLAADRGNNRVGVYRIAGNAEATTLGGVAGSPFLTGGTFTDGLALNQAGTFLYAANGNSRNLTGYRFNPATGGLTAGTIQPANALGTGGRLTGIAYVALPPNPAPTITSLTPNAAGAGGTAFTLTVAGTNFSLGSVVRWNNADRPTTFVGNTQLTAALTAADIAAPGTTNVTVVTPASATNSGGVSNALSFAVNNAVASVSAASFSGAELAAEAITAAFGLELATETLAAPGTPLPTTLAGTTVKVRDSAGMERLAPLFFVSPAQVNYLMPPGTTEGAATVTVTSGTGKISVGPAQLAAVAPGLFTANANGQGVAAAVAFRLQGDGTQSFEEVARFDAAAGRFVAVPIDLGPTTDQVFLLLFGTGLRGRSSLEAGTASIGGTPVDLLFLGPAPGLIGADQGNVGLPRSLAGRGEVDVLLTVEGKAANTVRINIR